MTRAEAFARAKTGGALIDLSSRAKWHLSGANRVRFLNGQVSNDIHKANGHESLHACVMTPKGKLCGDVWISAGADFLRIDAEPALRESLAARLERYIIADDVTLTDVTEDFCLIHCIVPPDAHPRVYETEDAFCMKAPRFGCGLEGIDLFLSREDFEETWTRLMGHFQPLDAELAEMLRIECGVPRWGAELDEHTLPSEAGLDQTAVDFHKGCYVGQEVVSRIKSVGHVNRELRRFISATPLSADMALYLPGTSVAPEEKPVGKLTSAAWSLSLEKWAALGYLKRGIDSPTLKAQAPDGTAALVEIRT